MESLTSVGRRRRVRTGFPCGRLLLVVVLLSLSLTAFSLRSISFVSRKTFGSIRPFTQKSFLCATDSSQLSKQSKLQDSNGSKNIVNGDHSLGPDSSSVMSKIAGEASDVLDSFYCALKVDDLSGPWTSRMDSESTFVEYTEDGLCLPAGPVGQFKEELANTLAEPIAEVTICASVLVSSALVAVSTLESMTPYMSTIRVTENFIGIIFAAEFFGRWFSSSKETGRHILNPQFALDVVVVILPLLFGLTPATFWADTWVPDWLTSPSTLINLELLRVLRLRRVLQDLDTFTKFERALGIPSNSVVQEWQLQLARVLLSLFTLLSVASGMIYTAEHDANPAMTDYFTALYFGLTTLTTVGFGGKLTRIVMFYCSVALSHVLVCVASKISLPSLGEASS